MDLNSVSEEKLIKSARMRVLAQGNTMQMLQLQDLKAHHLTWEEETTSKAKWSFYNKSLGPELMSPFHLLELMLQR